MLHPNTVLLTSDVATLVGVSSQTVRVWERTGRLVAFRTLKGVRLFAGSDVSRLIEERQAHDATTHEATL